MIYGKPTKYGSGVELLGDYNDFRELHGFISEISNETRIPIWYQDFLLAFAYEIRKAYEGFRDVKDAGHPLADAEHESLKYLSFKYLWIDYLLTIRLVRIAAGFRLNSLLDQSIIYRLESIGLESLKKFDANEGERIWETLQRLDVFDDKYPYVLIEQISCEFESEKNGKPRFRAIEPLLRSLHPFTEEYKFRIKMLERSAREHNCSIKDLRPQQRDQDLKNFKW